MTNATTQIFEKMNASIAAASAKGYEFSASKTYEQVDFARNIANLMETASAAYAEAMIDLAKLAISETGNGNLNDADNFREMVAEDLSENLLHSIRAGAYEMELELGSSDPNEEHRLSARQLGIAAE